MIVLGAGFDKWLPEGVRWSHAAEDYEEIQQAIEETSRLRAIDQTHFYGFFCLVFESKDTLGNLATLRRNVAPPRNTTHALVEAVTNGQGETANPDSNGDIVDRITGHIRNRQDAPANGTAANGANRGGTTTTNTPPPPPNNGRGNNSDPLSGVDL